MSRLLSRLLGIGADPRDDADLRLRKVLVLAAVVVVALATFLWGVIYWGFGQPASALVP